MKVQEYLYRKWLANELTLSENELLREMDKIFPINKQGWYKEIIRRCD
jgi:hypothetical protein